MKNDTGLAIIYGCVGAIAGVVLMTAVSLWSENPRIIATERQKAIEAGYGYYSIDMETGVKDFVYGPVPKGRSNETAAD